MPPRKRARSSGGGGEAVPSTPTAAEHQEDAAPATETSSHAAHPKEATAAPIEEVEILRSKVLTPYAVGITAMDANPDCTRLVVARENGTLVLFKIDYFQRLPHFIQLRNTGGRKNRSIAAILWVGGTTASPTSSCILVAYCSGQVVAYDSETLTPKAVTQRQGGAVLSMVRVGEEGICAAMSDGTWREFSLAHRSSELELRYVVNAVAGSDRALCIACSKNGSTFVGGDDRGNVVGWIVSDDGVRRRPKTTFSTRLPAGIALCCAVADETEGQAVVAVGTSAGDVVFLDLTTGTHLASYAHHKGPVSTVVCDGATVYASGWHESLRSYRPSGGDGGSSNSWIPAEVKRRTHFHETSALRVLRRRGIMLSASRDGTIMHAPLASLFSTPAQYVDVTTQRIAYASTRGVVVHSRKRGVEAFRMSSDKTSWVPWFSLGVGGQWNVTGMWCSEQCDLVVMATDVSVTVTRVEWSERARGGGAVVMKRVAAFSVAGVAGCCFFGANNVYILHDRQVTHVMLDISGQAAHVTLPETDAFHGIACDSASKLLVLSGSRSWATVSLAEDGSVDPASLHVNAGASLDNAAVVGGKVVGLLGNRKAYVSDVVNSNDDEEKKDTLPATLPHDVKFFCRTSRGLVGTFARGLLCAGEKDWNMFQRVVPMAAFADETPATTTDGVATATTKRIVLFERNVESELEQLPLCWKVRRFAN